MPFLDRMAIASAFVSIHASFEAHVKLEKSRVWLNWATTKLPLLSVGKGEFSGETSVTLRHNFEHVITALGFCITQVMEPWAGNAHVDGITPSRLPF